MAWSPSSITVRTVLPVRTCALPPLTSANIVPTAYFTFWKHGLKQVKL